MVSLLGQERTSGLYRPRPMSESRFRRPRGNGFTIARRKRPRTVVGLNHPNIRHLFDIGPNSRRLAASAWFGGKWAGWLAVILGTLVLIYFFLPPIDSFNFRRESLPLLVEFGH